MKKLLILACALVIATSAFAAQGKPVKASYSGIVEKYDAATKTLTVKKKDKSGDFIMVDSSTVVNGSAKADASALSAGVKVDVDFVMDGSKKVVQKVKINGPATKTK